MLTPHLKDRASSFRTANWLGGGAVLAAFVATFLMVDSMREQALHVAALATIAMAQGFSINREKSVADAHRATALKRCLYFTGAAAAFHFAALFPNAPLVYALWFFEAICFFAAAYLLLSDG
jgi:hypothetical protein